MARAEDAAVPEKLAAWQDTAYSQRYFLNVESPGEPGGIGLQPRPVAASVLLPLTVTVLPDGTLRVEPVLLVGEDGKVQPVSLTPSAGGSEVEVAFATHSGLRRFCLYAGAAQMPATASLTTFQPAPLRVRLRGKTAPPSFIYEPGHPLTLERFLQSNEREDTVLGPAQNVPNINNPECPAPFFSVSVDIFGHITRIQNPVRYCAVYEGLLRAPVSGEYKFALDTLGAAHVLIDGQPVISAELSDEHRTPFALNKALNLQAGMHRLVVYYAEAPAQTEQSNMALGLFGLRLHWSPPFGRGLICIPPQAFPRALTAVVTSFEAMPASGNGKPLPQPFIHVENVGHVRAGANHGDAKAREFIFLYTKAVGAPPETSLSLSTAGRAVATGPHELCVWVPAGEDVKIKALGSDKPPPERIVKFPTSRDGVKDVMDLEAELLVKSYPEFLYSDEMAHIHLETCLSPAPVIIPKERLETGLTPPAPRPMGEFSLWQSPSPPHVSPPAGAAAAQEKAWERAVVLDKVLEATPLEGARRKVLASFAASDLEALSRNSSCQLNFKLTIGGAPCEMLHFSFLHAENPHWPGLLTAGSEGLLFLPDSRWGTPVLPGENTVIFLPKESEAEFRRFAPLKALAREGPFKEALFLGDPLVESAPGETVGKAPIGIAERLTKTTPEIAWSGVCVPGPHRYQPIFQIMAGMESFAQSRELKVPPLVVLCLGSGDAARQTPLHTFERALDCTIVRLRLAGAKKIVVVGCIPEPFHEKNCEPYQERVKNVLRQHHLSGIDLLQQWTQESDWIRRFSTDETENAPAGPVPNSETLDEIVKLIRARL